MDDPDHAADPARLAQAAAWRVRLTEAGVETDVEIEAWIAAHPGNAAAWREAQALWASFGDNATAPELLAARRDALARARRTARTRWPPGDWKRPLAAAAAACILALVGLAAWRGPLPTTYQTARAERRIVSLPDGSVVTLDADTRLQVRYSAGVRRLTLVRGQARFDVAHDMARPFEVRAGDRTVLATGTSFDVEVHDDAVRVVLIEGRVSVLSPAGAAPVRLSPGQRLTAARPTGGVEVKPVDVGRATAWESGTLVFDDEPLSAVAADVSRYAARPVTVADARAARLRVSGVFKAGDLATFLDTVTQYLPVEAQSSPDGGVVLFSRPQPAGP